MRLLYFYSGVQLSPDVMQEEEMSSLEVGLSLSLSLSLYLCLVFVFSLYLCLCLCPLLRWVLSGVRSFFVEPGQFFPDCFLSR